MLGQPIGLLLAETLLIILAHYFASRRLVELPQALQERLEQEGMLVPESNPLWLPAHSVRIIIVLAFFAAAAALWWQGRLFAAGTLDTVGVFFAYLGGVLFNWLRHWRRRGSAGRRERLMHVKALAVLLACALLAALVLSGELPALPGWVEKLLLGLILFYFGSR
jgi:hypothetical protein